MRNRPTGQLDSWTVTVNNWGSADIGVNCIGAGQDGSGPVGPSFTLDEGLPLSSGRIALLSKMEPLYAALAFTPLVACLRGRVIVCNIISADQVDVFLSASWRSVLW
jgi:hypothetical protein